VPTKPLVVYFSPIVLNAATVLTMPKYVTTPKKRNVKGRTLDLSAVALYRNLKAQSATLAKELDSLEVKNRERTRSSLHKILAKYGAEEDVNQWTGDAKGTTTQQEIEQILDDRWSSVSNLVREQERIALLIQQKLSNPISSVKNDDEMDAKGPVARDLLPVLPKQPRPPFNFGFTAETETENSVISDNKNSYLEMVPNVLNQWVEAKLAASRRKLSHSRPSLLSGQMDVDAANASKLSDSSDTHRESLKVTHAAEGNGDFDSKLPIVMPAIGHKENQAVDDDSDDEGMPLDDDDPSTMLVQAQSFLGQDTIHSFLDSLGKRAGHFTNHSAKALLTAPEQSATASANTKKDCAVAVSNDPSPDVQKSSTKQGPALVHLVNKDNAGDPPNDTLLNQSGLVAMDNLRHGLMHLVPSMGATKPLAILERPIHIGFVLQRTDDQPYWGLTLSLFDNKVLIVGHVRQQAVKTVTKQAKAGYMRPWIGGVHQNPDTFLDGFQNQIPGPHELKPGDVILSINSRPTSTFPTLIAVTDYMKRFGSLCLEVLRAQTTPDNPNDNDSYDMTLYVYTSLQINNLMHLATGPGQENSSDSFALTMASKPIAQRQSTQPEGENSLQNFVIENVGFNGVHQPKSTERILQCAQRTSGPPTIKRRRSSTKVSNQLYNITIDDSTQADERPTMTPRRRSSKKVTNPMFNIPFDSTLAEDGEDGLRSKAFLIDVNYKNFPTWLSERKREWSKKWKKEEVAEVTTASHAKAVSNTWRNPIFKDNKGRFLSYEDNWDFNPEDGARAGQYLPEINLQNFPHWLSKRKEAWSENYQTRELQSDSRDDRGTESLQRMPKRKRINEEVAQESSQLEHKRKRIKGEELVHFPSPGGEKGEFDKWLVVRKKQWRASRRKRLRLSKLEKPLDAVASGAHVNVLLEEEFDRIPVSEQDFKLSNLLFGTRGASDDIVVHCLGFLHPSEHGKLMTISKKTSANIKRRDKIWRKLCSRWDLPAKPRKPWHEIYITRIRKEEEEYRSRADEIVHKAAVVLFKGDQLQKMEKIIATSQNKFDFDINHTCKIRYERNSILNLAVISQRYNIVKWLTETQNGLDLETRNQGGFTPLMNAAWAGDHHLVRLLIERGCDRSKIGTGDRYAQPVALSDRRPTPEARKQAEVLNLLKIRLETNGAGY
jgi:hypothetical protein